MATIERVLAFEPLREPDVVALDPEVTLAELGTDLLEIGYPPTVS